MDFFFGNKGENSLDLSEETPSESTFPLGKEPWHPDKAKMNLAYRVLTGIFVFFIITIFCGFLSNRGYLDSAMASSLFEMCRTGLLPIVTLILGYYFSKHE